MGKEGGSAQSAPHSATKSPGKPTHRAETEPPSSPADVPHSPITPAIASSRTLGKTDASFASSPLPLSGATRSSFCSVLLDLSHRAGCPCSTPTDPKWSHHLAQGRHASLSATWTALSSLCQSCDTALAVRGAQMPKDDWGLASSSPTPLPQHICLDTPLPLVGRHWQHTLPS